jgi:hypothetical protein
MDITRALKHRVATSILAGTGLFLAASAMSPGDTGIGPVPNQEVASAGAIVEPPAELPTTTVTGPVTTPAAPAPPVVMPTNPDQWFQPGGRNGGTEALARFLAAIALHENAPLYVSEQWGRTTGGVNSDHHISRSDSWAADLAVRGIQAPTPATELAARRVAAALGVPDWGGGDLTKTIGGYRFQVLWKVAGHFNHVHLGVRKL